MQLTGNALLDKSVYILFVGYMFGIQTFCITLPRGGGGKEASFSVFLPLHYTHICIIFSVMVNKGGE